MPLLGFLAKEKPLGAPTEAQAKTVYGYQVNEQLKLVPLLELGSDYYRRENLETHTRTLYADVFVSAPLITNQLTLTEAAKSTRDVQEVVTYMLNAIPDSLDQQRKAGNTVTTTPPEITRRGNYLSYGTITIEKESDQQIPERQVTRIIFAPSLDEYYDDYRAHDSVNVGKYDRIAKGISLRRFNAMRRSTRGE